VENFPACKACCRDVLGLPVQFEDDVDEYVEFKTGGTRLSRFNREKPIFLTRALFQPAFVTRMAIWSSWNK